MRHISEATLDLFRGAGRCALCHSWCQNLEAAHVIARGQGGGKRLDVPLNLLSLGPAFSCACHYHAHAGKVDPRKLFEAVAYREGLAWEFVESRLWELIRAPRECRVCPRCEGVGSIRLDYKWGLRRHECVCGSGIVGPTGEPWREEPRQFSGSLRRTQP